MNWYYSNDYTRLDDIIQSIDYFAKTYTEQREQSIVFTVKEKEGVYKWKLHSRGNANWDLLNKSINGKHNIDVYECLQLIFTCDGNILFGCSCNNKLNNLQEFIGEFNFAPFNF